MVRFAKGREILAETVELALGAVAVAEHFRKAIGSGVGHEEPGEMAGAGSFGIGLRAGPIGILGEV